MGLLCTCATVCIRIPLHAFCICFCILAICEYNSYDDCAVVHCNTSIHRRRGSFSIALLLVTIANIIQ